MASGTAIILAGGKSKRLGFDKQLICINDTPIVQYIAKQIEDIFKQIIIVTNTPSLYQHLNYHVIEDEYKKIGPIAGLYEGLKASSHSKAYAIGCDMPIINRKYIKYMQSIVGKNNYADAVITQYKEDMIEPLNSFYAQSSIPILEKMIKNQRRKISEVIEQINTYYISESIAREYSPKWEMFFNINTYKDLELAETITGQKFTIKQI